MRESDIKSLLKDVAGPNTKFQTINKWVMCRCPLARWTHEKGSDSKPSFGVHVSNDDVSKFNCFTCKKKGPLSYFLRLMEGFTGEEYGPLIRSLEKDEAYQAELPDWDTTRARVVEQEPETLPDHYLDIYEPMEELHPYLHARGIDSLQSIAESRIRIDPDDGHGAERIVFPVYNLQSQLLGFTGRATDDEVVPKVRDYFGLPKRDTLLGLHRIHDDTVFVILVEGLFDYLIGVAFDWPVLAVMHSSLTPAQARIIKEIGKPTYILFDDDVAGREGTKKAEEILAGFVPVMRCVYPKYEDDVAPTDPAEMWEEEWEKAIQDAVFT